MIDVRIVAQKRKKETRSIMGWREREQGEGEGDDDADEGEKLVSRRTRT